MQTEYEEAETLARSALTPPRRARARTLEAESKATGMVLNAQLAVTREGVRRWRDEQLSRGAPAPTLAAEMAPLSDVRPGPAPDSPFQFDADLDAELETLEDDMATTGEAKDGRLAGSAPPAV